MKTIAIANQTDSVGKTTLARNLAFYATDRGLRTLCFDLDPQRNFTKTLLSLRERANGNDSLPPSLTASLLCDKKANKQHPLDCGGGAYLVAAERELIDVAGMHVDVLQRPREVLAKLNMGLLPNMVNDRRAFDRNALEQLRDAMEGVVMKTVLNNRAATQYAKDRPVWRAQSGESQIVPAKEMKAVCAHIFEKASI